MESSEAQDLHQQMEMIYRQHEQELKKHQEELQGVEAKLIKRKMEIEQEETRLLAEKESLALEKEEIVKKQEELKQYQDRIKRELEHIRLENDHSFQWEEAKQGQESLQQTKPILPQEEIEDRRAEALPPSMDEWNQNPEELSEMMKQFVKDAKRIFSEGNILEATSELFCMGIGDKELRILSGNPPSAMIVAKREKNASLMKGITQLNRMQTDWEFSYENNCLKCIMPYTEAVPTEIVLKKCVEAITQYFK